MHIMKKTTEAVYEIKGHREIKKTQIFFFLRNIFCKKTILTLKRNVYYTV